MTKRPPQRPAGRPAAEAAPSFVPPVGMGAMASGIDADAGPAAETPAPRGEGRPVANRDQLASLLGDLLDQGSISVADEAAILREYDLLLSQLRVEKQRLEVEYRERVARDGEDATQAWLTEAATRLGRQQGEQMQRLLATMPALAREAAAG